MPCRGHEDRQFRADPPAPPRPLDAVHGERDAPADPRRLPRPGAAPQSVGDMVYPVRARNALAQPAQGGSGRNRHRSAGAVAGFRRCRRSPAVLSQARNQAPRRIRRQGRQGVPRPGRGGPADDGPHRRRRQRGRPCPRPPRMGHAGSPRLGPRLSGWRIEFRQGNPGSIDTITTLPKGLRRIYWLSSKFHYPNMTGGFIAGRPRRGFRVGTVSEFITRGDAANDVHRIPSCVW